MKKGVFYAHNDKKGMIFKWNEESFSKAPEEDAVFNIPEKKRKKKKKPRAFHVDERAHHSSFTQTQKP